MTEFDGEPMAITISRQPSGSPRTLEVCASLEFPASALHRGITMSYRLHQDRHDRGTQSKQQMHATAGSRKRKRNRCRPLIEAMEDRLLLSTIYWNNAAGGDWDTASNWKGGALPGPGDDAVINEPGGVVITHSQNTTDTINSLTASDPITLSSGTLTIGTSLTDSSAVSLAGGTLANATIQAGTVLQVASSNPVNTLQNVTLAGTLNINGGAVAAGAGLTLAGGTINLSNDGVLVFSGTKTQQTLGGTGSVHFTANIFGSSEILDSGSGNTLAIAAGVSIDGGAGTIDTGAASLDNQGTISGDAGGLPLAINGTTWTNEGIIQALTTGAVDLTGSWTNAAAGQLNASGGTLSLAGTWKNAGILSLTSNGTVDLGGSLTLASLGTFARSPTTSGTVNLTGVLNLSGQTLDASTGAWSLLGGTIIGGTVTDTLQVVSSNPINTLQKVMLAGTLNINGGAVAAGAGLTLAGGTINLSNDGVLVFSGTQTQQTLGGTGSVHFTANIFGSSEIVDSGSGNTLAIAAGVSIDGGAGTIDTGAASLDNQGTISGDAGGLPLAINGTTWTNEGIIQALTTGAVDLTGSWTNAAAGQLNASGGTLSLAGTWKNAGILSLTSNGTVDLGGSLTLASLGTFTRSSTTSGTVNLTGVLNLSGQTLDASTGAWSLLGGTIIGGTVTDTLQAAGSNPINTLQNVMLAGTLNINGGAVAAGAGLTLAGGTINLSNDGVLVFSGTQTQQTLGGTGSVHFTANIFGSSEIADSGSGNTLAIAAGISIDGGAGTIDAGAASLDNQGTISGDAGGLPLAINGTNWTNEGIIQALTNGTVDLTGSWTNAAAGQLNASVGTLSLAGNWNNLGTVQSVDGGSTFLGPDNTSGSGSFTNHGMITGVSGFIYLSSVLNNAGSTLALNDSTGSWYTEGGEILGGRVTTSGGAELIATQLGGTLAGVTLSGTLEMASPLLPPQDAGKVTVTGGLTLDSGSVEFAESAVMTFAGTQSLSGTGSVTFNGETGNNGIAVSSGGASPFLPALRCRGIRAPSAASVRA